MAKAEKPIHQQVAEAILKTLTPAYRKKFRLVPKGSYTAMEAEGGWCARITPKIVELNKKRIDEKALKTAGLTDPTKPFHFRHAGLPVPASEGGVEEQVKGLASLAEVGKAVAAAAKPVKESK